MRSDAAMVNASAPAVSKDTGKKKKNNRSAKLKQCKLDARREQWLSQVKNNSCKVVSEDLSLPTPYPLSLSQSGKDGSWGNKIKTTPKEENNDKLDDIHDSDSDSPFNSPTSSSSGTNYSMKNCSVDFGSGRSSISSGSYPTSVNEDKEDDGEEESGGGEEGGLDDWEAFADALPTTDDCQDHPKSETNVIPPAPIGQRGNSSCDGILKKPETNGPPLRAWRPDDIFRPQSLPSLSKNRSFPMDMHRKLSHGNIVWTSEDFVNQPSLCPICYEDLDLTDSSFLPCSCGFHLCLFCHKRIMEDDGRCPGCRKQYSPVICTETVANGGGAPQLLWIPRSCSMNSRS